MNILNTLKPSQLKHIVIKSLDKGMVLFRENDICDCIGIVIEGQISIVSYLENGKEIIYNTLKEDEIFGNNLIFSSEPHYKGNIITNVSSKIALIYKYDLINFLSNNKDFLIEYLKIQSDFGKTLNNRIKLLSIDSAEEKLYYYLHKNKGVIEYTTVSDLAKHLYLQRETLSRLISKLVKEKKIIKTKNTIKLL